MFGGQGAKGVLFVMALKDALPNTSLIVFVKILKSVTEPSQCS